MAAKLVEIAMHEETKSFSAYHKPLRCTIAGTLSNQHHTRGAIPSTADGLFNANPTSLNSFNKKMKRKKSHWSPHQTPRLHHQHRSQAASESHELDLSLPHQSLCPRKIHCLPGAI